MDRSTPNLPSRDFSETLHFYAALGFTERFRDAGWMILTRGSVDLEFFPHPELKPSESWFGCCLRLDDIDSFFDVCRAAGIPERSQGHPRIHAPTMSGGLRIGALLDPDGSLLRIIQNGE